MFIELTFPSKQLIIKENQGRNLEQEQKEKSWRHAVYLLAPQAYVQLAFLPPKHDVNLEMVWD